VGEEDLPGHVMIGCVVIVVSSAECFPGENLPPNKAIDCAQLKRLSENLRLVGRQRVSGGSW
jgi:hypothetical protein